MRGASIVGFANQHFKYTSGREVDWYLIGFSPRKKDITLYLMDGLDRHAPLLTKPGKHKTDKGCLYLRTIGDIDLPTLDRLIRASIRTIRSSPRRT